MYVDAEGREVEAPKPAAAGTESRQPPARRSESKPTRQAGGRRMDPPSWRRTFKRAGIFAPLFLVATFILGGDRMTVASAVLQTLMLLVVFVPFSYFMDRVFYRSFEKRAAKGRG